MSGAMLGSDCPYSTSLGLRLGLFPGPGSAPLGLAGAAMGAAAAHFSVTIARKEVAWMQGGINFQPAAQTMTARIR